MKKEKSQEKEVMHNRIAHHALMPSPSLRRNWWLLANSLSLYAEYDVLRYGISLRPVQSAFPGVIPPSFLCTSSVAEDGNLKSP